MSGSLERMLTLLSPRARDRALRQLLFHEDERVSSAAASALADQALLDEREAATRMRHLALGDAVARSFEP